MSCVSRPKTNINIIQDRSRQSRGCGGQSNEQECQHRFCRADKQNDSWPYELEDSEGGKLPDYAGRAPTDKVP